MKSLITGSILATVLMTGSSLPSQVIEADKTDFDQLRQENLEKDAVNHDELRQENLEKENGKVDFDQLRRENLEKDAMAEQASL